MAVLGDEIFFWKKKEFVSFVLSVFVFFIHCSCFAQYTSSGGIISEVNEKVAFFFKESITRFAVPSFYILSGIAFFKGYNNGLYFKKIKSRLFTLVIPYFLWNILWMLFDIVCSYSFLSNYFVGRNKFVFSIENVLLGIFMYKCNGPFWYILNLIIFSIAAPLIFAVVRNKYIGIVSVGVVTVLSFFEIGLPSSIFFVPESIIYYLIGAIVGQHFFGMMTKKASKITQWISLAFLAAYVFAKNVFANRINSNKFLVIAVFVIAFFALWNITDMFIDKIKASKIFTRSFAIYAMHMNVSAMITKLLVLCLPRNDCFAIPNFIGTTILTVVSIHLICVFLEKFFPRFFAMLMGKRVKR